VASVGSKGDSYDNAVAENFNGRYKWEPIYRHGPRRGLDDVEYATLTYVDWFNHPRLHGEITNGPGHKSTSTSASWAGGASACGRVTLGATLVQGGAVVSPRARGSVVR
jgi:transposase InsO family protein